MSSSEKNAETPRKAGAFDIRVFIALLIGFYGVVLLVAGLIGPSDAALEKADGWNVNLYAGMGMVVVSALFLLWARLRPVVVVPADADANAGDAGRGEGH
jgi:hypothetical protein